MRTIGGALDEDAAWALVRATLAVTVAGGPGTRPGGPSPLHRRIPHPDRREIWLDIDATGHWQANPSPSESARDVVDVFLPLALRPDLVIGQLGQSLDGRIATESGHSHYVTGPADIRRLHRLRALVDAVVVGAGTVAHDDPRLTVREVEGANPVRVVLDPEDRLERDRRVFTDGAARTLVVRRIGAHRAAPRIAAESDIVIELETRGGEGFDPADVLAALRARGLNRVLVEGGGVTVSRFLQAGVLDRLHITVAPLLIGSGRPALTLPAISSLDQALRPRCRHYPLGADLLFDLDLR